MDAITSDKNPKSLLSNIALNYEPSEFPRELARHYISASEQDISDMLKQIGVDCIDDLFSHIPESLQLKNVTELPKEL